MMSSIYRDDVFAAIDRDHTLERIAGGNETEVYRSDDSRFVVKLKGDLGGDVAQALGWAKTLRAAAESFAACLGPAHSIPSYYFVARDGQGHAQVLILQPYLPNARPLAEVDLHSLPAEERTQIAAQLRDIVGCARRAYRRSGAMPDLYGRSSASSAERKRLNAPHMLLWRLWGFLVRRTLLRSHNLLVQRNPTPRVVLVDYDPVRQSRLYRRLYYAVRLVLFLRDRLLIARLAR
jgi:hypothetical protein